MNPLVYNDDYFNTTLDGDGDDTLGFAFVAPLIAAAPSIFSAISSLFGGGRQAQYQGLAEINQAGQQATSAMDSIKAGLASGQMAPAQAISEANKIVQQFNDPSIVYPAKKGNDATARNNFIAQLNQQLNEIKAMAATVQQQAAANSGGSIAGLSTNTLLLVGGGLTLFMLVKK